MNYRLSIQSQTYPVEDIQLPSESTLEFQPVGKPFSFVSPVRLRAGQQCVLLGDSAGYQLLVNACFGFTFSLKYYVSGIIATREPVKVHAS